MYINLNLISNTDHWKEKITSAENHVIGKCIYIVNDLQIIANAFQQYERLLCQGYSCHSYKYGVVLTASMTSHLTKYRPVNVLFAHSCMVHSIFSFITLSPWIPFYSLSSHPKVLLFLRLAHRLLQNYNSQEGKEEASAEFMLQSS